MNQNQIITPERAQEIFDAYSAALESCPSRTEARKKVCSDLGVGDSTVYKYAVLPRSGKPKPVSETLPTAADILKQTCFLKQETPALPENIKTFILTGWEIRSEINWKFIDCLKQIGRKYDATLQLAVCFLPDLEFLPNEVRSSFEILTEDFHYNENLFFKFVQTHALASSPLTGWRGAFEKTAIIPGLIKEMQSEPTQKSCKWIVSTGSLGHLDPSLSGYAAAAQSPDEAYRKRFQDRHNKARSQKKTTAIAREYVKPSALVIHVLGDKLFLIRTVTMETGGVVYDLDKKYTAGERSPKKSRPAFLNIGDSHEFVASETAVKTSYNQILSLQPEKVFLNDFTDGLSANHHEKDRALQFHEAPSIEEEIASAIARLKIYKSICATAGSELFYLHSNHDDFFEKFLDAGEKYWKLNRNYNTCVRLQHLRHTTGLHPIQLLIDFPALGIEFVPDKKPYRTAGIDVHHGHAPVNGKRSTPKGLISHYNYTSFGHFHAPGWWRNGMWAGMSADQSKMSYLEGISGMMHANIIGQPDGSQQLLADIGGIWRI